MSIDDFTNIYSVVGITNGDLYTEESFGGNDIFMLVVDINSPQQPNVQQQFGTDADDTAEGVVFLNNFGVVAIVGNAPTTSGFSIAGDPVSGTPGAYLIFVDASAANIVASFTFGNDTRDTLNAATKSTSGNSVFAAGAVIDPATNLFHILVVLINADPPTFSLVFEVTIAGDGIDIATAVATDDFSGTSVFITGSSTSSAILGTSNPNAPLETTFLMSLSASDGALQQVNFFSASTDASIGTALAFSPFSQILVAGTNTNNSISYDTQH